MSQITSHILDATQGRPATDVAVALRDADGVSIASGHTDVDGRIALGPDVLPLGDYALDFATGEYFTRRGEDTFYPRVTIAFAVTDGAHRHVPLLLSPFAYSTYRGS